MMRSLYTAGSGMKAQQFNVDIISNNLANVNTTGYKKERAEFKDCLYETLSRAYVLDQQGKPANLQVGHGAIVSSVSRDFDNGNTDKTDSTLDFAIEGDGFFTVIGPSSEVQYTRDGAFKVSVTADGQRKLTTSDGYDVLDDSGQQINISNDIDVAKLVVSPKGQMSYVDKQGVTNDLGQTIGMVTFPNKFALEAVGRNLFSKNSATGEPIQVSQDENSTCIMTQGCLEGSNVQVVDEMVKLIVAQRAYEVSSKAITSSDEMLGMANNLKR
jgi:flagellar basal-body rod protein FlgG